MMLLLLLHICDFAFIQLIMLSNRRRHWIIDHMRVDRLDIGQRVNNLIFFIICRLVNLLVKLLHISFFLKELLLFIVVIVSIVVASFGLFSFGSIVVSLRLKLLLFL